MILCISHVTLLKCFCAELITEFAFPSIASQLARRLEEQVCAPTNPTRRAKKSGGESGEIRKGHSVSPLSRIRAYFESLKQPSSNISEQMPEPVYQNHVDLASHLLLH